MLQVTTSQNIYTKFANSLIAFLEESCSLDENKKNLLGAKEYRDVSRQTAHMILDEYHKTVIVNDIKWNHFDDPLGVGDSAVDVFRGVLSKYRYFVSKRFDTNIIPQYIFDVTELHVDGALKEELMKIL